jgi:hypothetical protein
MKNFFYFKIKNFLTIVFLLCFLLLPSISFASLSDAFKAGDNSALGSAASQMGYDTSGETTPETVVGTVIQVILGVLGVVFIVLIIYGGVLWMTAGGNEEKVTRAQSIIKRAVVGLIIVIGAYAISVFVVNAFINQASGA